MLLLGQLVHFGYCWLFSTFTQTENYWFFGSFIRTALSARNEGKSYGFLWRKGNRACLDYCEAAEHKKQHYSKHLNENSRDDFGGLPMSWFFKSFAPRGISPSVWWRRDSRTYFEMGSNHHESKKWKISYLRKCWRGIEMVAHGRGHPLSRIDTDWRV